MAATIPALDPIDDALDPRSSSVSRSPAASFSKGVREAHASARSAANTLKNRVFMAVAGLGALAGVAHAEPMDARRHDGLGASALQVADAGALAGSGNVVMSDAGPGLVIPTVEKQPDGSYRQVADATQIPNPPIELALKPEENKTNIPVLTQKEIAELDPNKIDYASYMALPSMFRERWNMEVYVNPRENERRVEPIDSRKKLGSLVDGGEDMPIETIEQIFGKQKITAANLGDFLARLTNPKEYHQIVSWRTAARKDATGNFVKDAAGKPIFDPIFEPNSTKARPGMEAVAEKILSDIGRQYENLVVKRIRGGQVDAQTLERWAHITNAIIEKMNPTIFGRETLRRAIVNGGIGIDFEGQNFQKYGVASLLGKSVIVKEIDPQTGKETDQETGVSVYQPSHASRRILSSAVELARLLQLENPGTEYYSRVRIDGDETSLKIGDIGAGKAAETIRAITQTPEIFWLEMRRLSHTEGAIALAVERIVKSPKIRARIQAETVDTLREWGARTDSEVWRQNDRMEAVKDAKNEYKKQQGTDSNAVQLAIASMNLNSVGWADEVIASVYWRLARVYIVKNGADLNKELGFYNPLGGISGTDGDNVRERLLTPEKMRNEKKAVPPS